MGTVLMIAAAVFAGGCAEIRPSRRERTRLPPETKVSVYDDHDDSERMRAKLTALRRMRGVSPAAPFMVGQTNLKFVKERIANGENPENALAFDMQAIADDSDGTVRYWTIPARDPEWFDFPEPFLTITRLRLAIAVIRSDGSGGRGYYVLLVSPSFDNFMMTR